MSTPSVHEKPQYFDALLRSFSMIIVSEIGDKTFLIAAILAMRHPRLQVFAGAFISLVLMSILSAALGHILPTLIPKFWTQAAAGLLFLVFGGKMWAEARGMEKGQGKMVEEMKEAQEEIEEDEANADGGDVPLEAMEAGRREADNSKKAWVAGLRNFCNFFLGPVFVQAFVLTFLGEWGDRSQIATIALGASHASRIQCTFC
jgi:Ca2+/H+ antiporter, TMEM165/GDT1 family